MTSVIAATDVPAGAPSSLNFFVSGHSLTDLPYPTYLAAISQSLGTSARWNRQYMVGSPIRKRSGGLSESGPDWSGYRQGDNREGHGMDVLAELRAPRSLGGAGAYDVLIITEQNGLLETLFWHDTVRYLRHYHDRFIEGNAHGRTLFYEPWVSIDNLDDPRRWIALERQAAKVWQCFESRINLSLSAERRADRIESLPVGSALVSLVERATQGSGLAELTGKTVRETMSRLFQDEVHLTALGSYYMALVSQAAISKRSVVGAWAPPEVSPSLALALQRMASDFMTSHSAANPPLDMERCRQLLKDSFINQFYGYIRDAWKDQVGLVRADGRRIKRLVHWHLRVRRDTEANPFYFNPATDKRYWLPKPP